MVMIEPFLDFTLHRKAVLRCIVAERDEQH
jgi:hypothetical protein